MTRSQRLLAILEYLRGRTRPVTAARLAQHFQLSERSIYRDIAALNQQGARIAGSAGSGFVLEQGLFLPPLSFTAEEAAAVLLGLRFVSRRGDSALVRAAQAAHAKMAAQSPDLFGPSGSAGLLVAPSGYGPARDTLRKARQAICAERIIVLSYRDGEGRETRRRVWPLALGWFDQVEMLAGWCELRSNFRNFRIDRISELDVLDESLPRPHQVLLEAYLQTDLARRRDIDCAAPDMN